MKKELESRFVTRQYMLAQDFEVYYYSDSGMAEVRTHFWMDRKQLQEEQSINQEKLMFCLEERNQGKIGTALSQIFEDSCMERM